MQKYKFSQAFYRYDEKVSVTTCETGFVWNKKKQPNFDSITADDFTFKPGVYLLLEMPYGWK